MKHKKAFNKWLDNMKKSEGLGMEDIWNAAIEFMEKQNKKYRKADETPDFLECSYTAHYMKHNTNKEYVVYIEETDEIRVYSVIPKFVFYVDCNGISKNCIPIIVGEL